MVPVCTCSLTPGNCAAHPAGSAGIPTPGAGFALGWTCPGCGTHYSPWWPMCVCSRRPAAPTQPTLPGIVTK